MKSYWPLVILLAVFAALAFGYSIVTPLGEAPDEVSHWAYVQYLVTRHALPKPEGAVLGESHQPPLYYLFGALATFCIPQPDFPALTNPDFAFGQPQTPNLLLHTRREQFPYSGVPLAWHIWRLFSVGMGVVTVWATYQTCQLWPDLTAPFALAAAAFVAFLPAFNFLSGMVNNDNLIIMLSALGILQSVRILRGGPRPRSLVLLGVLLGLSALTKLSGLVLWLFAGALLAWQAWPARDWRALLRSAAWTFLPALIIVLPWMVYNLLQYGDPLAWSLVMRSTPVRREPISWQDIGVLLAGLWTSFWGRFGGALHLRMADWVYAALGAIPVLALAGWLRRGHSKTHYGIVALFALFWLFLLTAFARWTLVMLGTDQARQLYPGLSLLAMVLVLGLARLFASRAHLALTLASAALLALDIAALAFLGLTFAPPQPMLNFSPPSDSAYADFSNTIRVLAYGVPTTRAAPGDTISVVVQWQALKDPSEDYWLLLQLVGAGEPVVNKDGVPGAGRYTTDWWRRGEVYLSLHTLRLPDDLAPGTYTLRLGLHPFGDSQWLAVRDQEMLELARIEVGAPKP